MLFISFKPTEIFEDIQIKKFEKFEQSFVCKTYQKFQSFSCLNTTTTTTTTQHLSRRKKRNFYIFQKKKKKKKKKKKNKFYIMVFYTNFKK